MKFSYNKYSIRSKNLRTYRKIILMLAVIFPLQLMAQSVSNLRAQFTGCKAVVNFTLTSGNAIDLTLMYTGDGGKTWLPCTTVSGDITGQTTGNKQIVWDCYADGIRWGLVEFKINLPQTGCGSTLMEMVKVTGGTFQMGSTTGDSDEQLVHSVTLSDFCIGKYEVTQKQWYDIMGSYPGTAPSSTFGKGDNYPMYNVSWNDIVGTTGTVAYTINGISYRTDGYCYKLSYKADPALSMKYRLPTEAEWEYAARGGAQSKGYNYSGSNTLDNVAWYSSNSSSTTHTIGTKQPNELGIYDMSGNVWEWCGDWFGAYSSGTQTNPTGATNGSYRVVRGGSWGYDSTVSVRGITSSSGRDGDDVGFRLVLVP